MFVWSEGLSQAAGTSHQDTALCVQGLDQPGCILPYSQQLRRIQTDLPLFVVIVILATVVVGCKVLLATKESEL